MSLYRKVLIPLDGSKLAEAAIEVVEPQLKSAGEVVLVTTIDPYVSRQFADLANAERISVYEAVERYHRDIAADLESRGVRARTRYSADPDAAAGVLEMIRSEEPTLVVMSSHGRTGLSRLMLGSVAGSILKGVTCPTLIVPSR